MAASNIVALACALVFAGSLFEVARADDSIKSVGIISAIGDTMTKKTVGLTMFDNSDQTEAIDNWQVDEFVIAEFAAQLKGRYEIKPVAYSKSDFAAKQKGIFVDSDFDAEKSITHLNPAAEAVPDAYIIVTKSFTDDYIRRTNQHLFGVGLYDRNGGANTGQAIYAAYEINVVDGHSLKYLTSHYPHGLLSFAVTADYDRMVFRNVDNLWSDGFVMTPQQRERARDALKDALREAVTKTIKDFDFESAAPPSR